MEGELILDRPFEIFFLTQILSPSNSYVTLDIVLVKGIIYFLLNCNFKMGS